MTTSPRILHGCHRNIDDGGNECTDAKYPSMVRYLLQVLLKLMNWYGRLCWGQRMSHRQKRCRYRLLSAYGVKVANKQVKIVNHIQRVKIVINNNIIEQVTDFKYLGYFISEFKSDVEDKLQTYNKINGAIRRHFGKKLIKKQS